MNKKKILFILGCLDSGGVAKSLVSLLNVIDKEKYDVSLLLCSERMGPFAELLPKDVHVIMDETLSHVGSVGGLRYLLMHGHILLFLGTLLRLVVSRFSKAWSGYILSRLMPAIPGEWDLIVDYNGQQQTYYMVDKLKAKKKAAFFHSDYAKWPYYYKFDKKYYPKLDAIFTISPICVASLKRFFPEQADMIHLMENISSMEIIDRMASENIGMPRKSEWTFLTVGHICKNKGTDMAIKAGRMLKDKGIDFTLYFIGSTEELSQFTPLIEELGLKDNFVFLGLMTNPYPWFKATDIVVHPSLFEGKSVTLDEAKLLCKPVVVTNFSTVRDQFVDGVNANIVEMTPEAIADGIMDLINNPEKLHAYKEWLKENRRDNSSEVNKIYKLLGV